MFKFKCKFNDDKKVGQVRPGFVRMWRMRSMNESNHRVKLLAGLSLGSVLLFG
jgi:hypothetical protein